MLLLSLILYVLLYSKVLQLKLSNLFKHIRFLYLLSYEFDNVLRYDEFDK